VKSSRTAGLVAGAVGLAALVASSCQPDRLECGPGSEVFRTIDTVQAGGDTLLRIARLDSIRCELSSSADAPEPVRIRRVP
jgi:hypothetical protein